MTPHSILANIVLFVDAVRRVGIPVSVEQSAELADALTLIDIGRRDQVYFAAQGLLLDRYENRLLFETVFNRFWRANHSAAPGGQTTRPHRAQRRATVATLMAAKATDARPLAIQDRSHTYSSAELLQRKRFVEMSDEELEAVKRLLQQMRWRVAERVTRRRVADRSGDQLHLRQTLRSYTKHGGVPLTLAYRRRKIKPRPIVLLADISGSMEKVARLLLLFFYAVGHSHRNVESFVFGTRLTRITKQLKLKNVDRALDEAAREVVDWAGGTRIGESLQQFNQQWSRRVLGRGAIIIIISDGWERGDAAQLADAMRFLQHRSHRLIWLNPLAGSDSYQPLVGGMRAALPYIDHLRPLARLHDLQTLADELKQIN